MRLYNVSLHRRDITQNYLSIAPEEGLIFVLMLDLSVALDWIDH